MADENKIKTGDVVTVINSGDHDLYDAKTGCFYPARTEVKVKVYSFIEEQMAIGNMKLTSDKDAPKAAEGNEALDFTEDTDVAAPVNTKDNAAFETDPDQIKDGDVSSEKLVDAGREGRSRRGK